jgi:hypothetical protein
VTDTPGGHESLVEVALCRVGVVTAGGQDDGALFPHRLVCARPTARAGNLGIRPRAYNFREKGDFSKKSKFLNMRQKKNLR